MRTFLCTIILVVVVAVGAGFYTGLWTISAHWIDKDYVVSLMIHPDALIPTHSGDSSSE